MEGLRLYGGVFFMGKQVPSEDTGGNQVHSPGAVSVLILGQTMKPPVVERLAVKLPV